MFAWGWSRPDEARLVPLFLGVDPHDRHVLARQELLDRAGPFEDLEGRADGLLVEVEPGLGLDLGVRQLDRVGIQPAQEVVDPVDGRGPRGIRSR